MASASINNNLGPSVKSFKEDEYLNEKLSPHVKEEQLQPIVAAFEKTFGKKQIKDLVLLTGGRGTSKIFKFEVDNKEHVCRVTDSARPNFFIDASSEVVRMKIASELGVTPKLHYADERTGVLIMDYIPNLRLTTQIQKCKGNTAPYYRLLAQTIKTLHKGPALSEKYEDIFSDVNRTAHASDRTMLPPESLTVMDVVLPLEKVLKGHQTNIPCHKELNGNNVLFDGKKIYFIDFESSGNCDPFVDLAILCNFFIFDSSKENLFLQSYFSSVPTPEQKAHLYLMKTVCLAFYAFKSQRRVTCMGKRDLSKECVDLKSFPKYKKFVLEFFNGCTKVLDMDDFRVLTYVFIREVLKKINSDSFRNAIQVLNKDPLLKGPSSSVDHRQMKRVRNKKRKNSIERFLNRTKAASKPSNRNLLKSQESLELKANC